MGNETVNANGATTTAPPATTATPATEPAAAPNATATTTNANTIASANATPAPSANNATPTTPATPSIDRAAVLTALGITDADLAAIRAQSSAQTDRKQVLVSALAEAQDTFTADQLNAMDTATLEGIADLVGPALGVSANVVTGDFRGARPRAVANRDDYTPPDPHGVNELLYGSGSSAASAAKK